ncbi:MAG: hypothetical protein ACLQVJ_23615 [Syntrophobacteraceae bacterium]
MEKYYISHHISGYGRFFIITTAQKSQETENIIAEAYVFGLDSADLFKGKWIQYNYREGDEKVGIIDVVYMQKQALNAAVNIIREYQTIKYTETKDVDYLKDKIELQECGNEALVTLKNIGYEEDLEQLAKDTGNSELRRYIRVILSFQFVVRTYEKPAR